MFTLETPAGLFSIDKSSYGNVLIFAVDHPDKTSSAFYLGFYGERERLNKLITIRHLVIYFSFGMLDIKWWGKEVYRDSYTKSLSLDILPKFKIEPFTYIYQYHFKKVFQEITRYELMGELR